MIDCKKYSERTPGTALCLLILKIFMASREHRTLTINHDKNIKKKGIYLVSICKPRHFILPVDHCLSNDKINHVICLLFLFYFLSGRNPAVSFVHSLSNRFAKAT